MADEMSPETRQNAKDALAYLTAIHHRPGDPASRAMRHKLLDETGVENLLAGMTSLVNIAAWLRHHDTNGKIQIADTLREMGETLAERG